MQPNAFWLLVFWKRISHASIIQRPSSQLSAVLVPHLLLFAQCFSSQTCYILFILKENFRLLRDIQRWCLPLSYLLMAMQKQTNISNISFINWENIFCSWRCWWMRKSCRESPWGSGDKGWIVMSTETSRGFAFITRTKRWGLLRNLSKPVPTFLV